MIVKLPGDRLIKVRFSYFTGATKNGPWQFGRKDIDKAKYVKTECEIHVPVTNIEKTWTVLATGSTIKSKKDAFNKAVGRKLALTRALAEVKIDDINKSDRRIIWERYFDLHRDGYKVPMQIVSIVQTSTDL